MREDGGAQPGTSRALQFVLVSVALLVVGILLIADQLGRVDVDVPIGVLATLLIIAFWANAKRDLITPLNVSIAYFLVFYVVGSKAQIGAGGLYPDQAVTKALFLATLGFAGFWAGYCLPLSSSLLTARAQPSRQNVPMQRGRLTLASLGVLSLSTVLLVVYLRVAGEGNYFSSSLYGQRIEASRGRYFLTWGITFASSIPILWYACREIRVRSGLVVFGVEIMTLLAASLVLVFPLGARTPLLYPALSLVICRNYLTKRLAFKTALLAGIVLATCAVAYQLHRYSTLGYLTLQDIPHLLRNWSSFWQYLAAEWMTLGDLALAVSVWPAFRPFMLGQSYLMLFVTPIPRIFWSSKPSWEVSHLMNLEIYGPDQAQVWGGRAVGTVGEAYVNFGVFGVIAVLLLVGISSRYVYEWVCRNRDSEIVTPIYAAYLYSLFIALRGELAAGVIQFVQFAVPLVMIYLFSSKRIPQATGV